ncbi:Uncharacterized protein APZ42_001144, partial [Daphnia magna]
NNTNELTHVQAYQEAKTDEGEKSGLERNYIENKTIIYDARTQTRSEMTEEVDKFKAKLKTARF